MALTEKEAQVIKQSFKQIIDSQNFIRKVMPKQTIAKDAELYTIEKVELDDSILSKTGQELVEIPYTVSTDSRKIFDLAAKVTRPRRLLTATNFQKISQMLAKIITKSENYYGIQELTKGVSQKVSSPWSSASQEDIVEEVIKAVQTINQYTTAPINLILPTNKSVYFKKPNQYGLSPSVLLSGVINNVYVTNLLPEDTGILVPLDPTIVSFNVAEEFHADKKVDLNTTTIWVTEAICPALEQKEAVVVLKGI